MGCVISKKTKSGKASWVYWISKTSILYSHHTTCQLQHFPAVWWLMTGPTNARKTQCQCLVETSLLWPRRQQIRQNPLGGCCCCCCCCWCCCCCCGGCGCSCGCGCGWCCRRSCSCSCTFGVWFGPTIAKSDSFASWPRNYMPKKLNVSTVRMAPLSQLSNRHFQGGKTDSHRQHENWVFRFSLLLAWTSPVGIYLVCNSL